MSTNTFERVSGNSYSRQQGLKRSPITAIVTAKLFRDASKVKNLQKRTANTEAEDELELPVAGELVAEHEWESMLHTFEPEADELSPGTGGAASDDLWERLSSTRWLKSTSPRDEMSENSESSESEDISSAETKV